MDAKDWQPTAAYLYLLHQDVSGLAWEYLRRNPNYRRDWERFGQHQLAHRAQHWQLLTLENPCLDARTVQPQWIPSPLSVIHLTEADELSEAIPFSLWRLPGRKTLVCDGARILVSTQVNQETIRITLNAGLRDGARFACALPAVRNMRTAYSAAYNLVGLLSAAGPARRCRTSRPTRQALVHMRSIHALDALAAGATHREIADAIFGRDDTWQRWDTNSELRAHVRYLLRRGQTLVNGGYRRLLTPTRIPKDGESTAHVESP